ncbi:MAG: porin [Rubrivivax sp.]|nr:MAG: porin [Rubrivivax sp.]
MRKASKGQRYGVPDTSVLLAPLLRAWPLNSFVDLENSMKKTLLAAAALLAVSGSAFAQSSVTLYGLVDLSIESVKGTDTVTRLASDNYNSSRLGFRGVEDLGGGLKAKFTLESGLNADIGSAGSGAGTSSARFFSRAAWVGLEGGFGEIRLGRQDSTIGAIAGNTSIVGTQSYDEAVIADTFAGRTYRRLDNAITYITPKFVDGLQVQLQYSTAADGTTVTNAEAAADSDQGKTFGFSATYAAGPFGIGGAYLQVKNDVAGDVDDQSLLAYASFDFGAAKLVGYYNVDKRDNTAEDRKLYGAKVLFPIGNAFKMNVGVAQVKDQSFAANREDDSTFVTVEGVYALSKRTELFGLLTTVDNDDQTNLAVSRVANTAGKNSHGIAFGVRHSF